MKISLPHRGDAEVTGVERLNIEADGVRYTLIHRNGRLELRAEGGALLLEPVVSNTVIVRTT